MVFVGGGLEFKGTGDGGAIVTVRMQCTENASVLRILTFSPQEWREVTAEVYGPPPDPPED
jgi:hypothetical protein